MRTIFLANLFIAALAVSVIRAAADAPPAPRTVAEYLALARAHNPDVASALARARAAREHVGVAKGFPDPSLLYGYWVSSPPAEMMKGRSELLFMQPIPFPGKRGLRGGVAAREAAVADRASQEIALDLDYEVKVAFYNFVRVVEVESVLVDERQLLHDMREVTRVREAAGSAPQQDVLKLDLAIAEIDDQMSMVEHEEDRTRAHLNHLMGRHAHEPLPSPTWSVPSASSAETLALADSALVRRPEVGSAMSEVEAAELSRRLAKREYFPDLMLGVKWEFGGDDGMDDAWMLMAGIDVPIWFGKRRAMVRQAEAMGEAARYRLRADSLRVHREVEDAIHGVRSARERLERFQQRILPRAEQAFQSSEAGYRGGRVEFIDYLDSQRMWLALRREYFDVVAELGTEVAALERAIAARE
jgi:cobalt-zinc-cadmium efflux system outer membrane protein